MKGTILLETLKGIEGPSEIKLSPGPFLAAVNEHDALAAELIEWLTDRLPDDATFGDAEDVLLSAQWWLVFMNMQPRYPVPLVEEPEGVMGTIYVMWGGPGWYAAKMEDDNRTYYLVADEEMNFGVGPTVHFSTRAEVCEKWAAYDVVWAALGRDGVRGQRTLQEPPGERES